MIPEPAPLNEFNLPLNVLQPNVATMFHNALRVAYRGNPGSIAIARLTAPIALQMMYLAMSNPDLWIIPLAAVEGVATEDGDNVIFNRRYDAKARLDTLHGLVRGLINSVVSSGRVVVPNFRDWYEMQMLGVPGTQATFARNARVPWRQRVLNFVGYDEYPDDLAIDGIPLAPDAVVMTAPDGTVLDLLTGAQPVAYESRRIATQHAAPPGAHGTFLTHGPLHPWSVHVACSLYLLDAGRITMKLVTHHQEFEGLTVFDKPLGEIANVEQILRELHAAHVLYTLQASILQIGITQNLWEVASQLLIAVDRSLEPMVKMVDVARNFMLTELPQHPLISWLIQAASRIGVTSYDAYATMGLIRCGGMRTRAADPREVPGLGEYAMREAARATVLQATYAQQVANFTGLHGHFGWSFVGVTPDGDQHAQQVGRLAMDPVLFGQMITGNTRVFNLLRDAATRLGWPSTAVPVATQGDQLAISPERVLAKMRPDQAPPKPLSTAPLQLRQNGAEFDLTDGKNYRFGDALTIVGLRPVFAVNAAVLAGITGRRHSVIENPPTMVSVIEHATRMPGPGSRDLAALFLQPAGAHMGRTDAYLTSVDPDDERVAEVAHHLAFTSTNETYVVPGFEGPTLEDIVLTEQQFPDTVVFGTVDTTIVAEAEANVIEAWNSLTVDFALPEDEGRYYRLKNNAVFGARTFIVRAWSGDVEVYTLEGVYVHIAPRDGSVWHNHDLSLGATLKDAPTLVAMVVTTDYGTAKLSERLAKVLGEGSIKDPMVYVPEGSK